MTSPATEPNEAKECLSCGIQLNPDGTVDALEDGETDHFLGCDAPTADQIQVGQKWYVVSRDMDGVVTDKFIGADGVPHVRLQRVGADWECFNWPWQLRPAQCIGRRHQQYGQGPTIQCASQARPGTEYCKVCER